MVAGISPDFTTANWDLTTSGRPPPLSVSSHYAHITINIHSNTPISLDSILLYDIPTVTETTHHHLESHHHYSLHPPPPNRSV
ncbi:hypothetical protein Tco_0377193 [Tanacetum coccineum]